LKTVHEQRNGRGRGYEQGTGAPQVIVIDTKKGEEIHRQPLSLAKANYPMA
jgi:hypothetical protein